MYFDDIASEFRDQPNTPEVRKLIAEKIKQRIIDNIVVEDETTVEMEESDMKMFSTCQFFIKFGIMISSHTDVSWRLSDNIQPM